MRILGTVVVSWLASGCFAHEPLRSLPGEIRIPSVESGLKIMGLEGAENPFSKDELIELGQKCQVENQRLITEIANGRDTPTKWKTGIGAVTGAVGTIGSLVTAGSGASTTSQTQDDRNRTLGFGIGTAALTALGTVILLVVSPGETALRDLEIQQKKIATDLTEFTQKCGQTITNANAAQCYVLLGSLKTSCNLSDARKIEAPKPDARKSEEPQPVQPTNSPAQAPSSRLLPWLPRTVGG